VVLHKASHASHAAGHSRALGYGSPAPPSPTDVPMVLRGPDSASASSVGARRHIHTGARMTATPSGPLDVRTVERALTSPRIWELKGQLESLSGLATGWDSYDAGPPNATAMRNARILLEARVSHGASILPTRISTSVEGGVGFVFREAGRYADIECFNSGEAVTAVSDESGGSSVEEWSGSETEAMIDWLRCHVAGRAL
jgi:hypothetical protein